MAQFPTCMGRPRAVVNCLFSLNTAGVADNIPGMGGAVYTSNSSPTFINCTFAGNNALDPVSITSYGGAMYTTGSGTSDDLQLHSLERRGRRG